MRIFYLFIIGLLFISCNTETLPKPKGYLNLNYPKKNYKKLPIQRPYSFDISKNTIIISQKNDWLKIKYPALKASIDITYRPIKNNLKELLIEAEKLVFEHTIKAEKITSNNFENPQNNVFGSIYDITGNSASQVQFHATDSTNHFLKGSLFFYVKPNYDSVLPAVAYIKKDMIRIMESLKWKK